MTTNRLTRIAIVEDNATMRKSLTTLLDGTPGYRCVCACDCAEDALTEIPKHLPDVVLMDIHLPGESGIACTARLTDKLPELQVIMLTVYKDTKLIFQALKAGACGYVLKRSRPEEILEAIAEVRTGGAPMTGEIARMVVRSFKQAQPNNPNHEGLSGRELEILTSLSEGLSNKEIGVSLNISAGTVRSHLMRIFKKLHVHCRSEAVAKYLRAQSSPPG
jgi:DNA-binding NarL/FixJ family response regulator